MTPLLHQGHLSGVQIGNIPLCLDRLAVRWEGLLDRSECQPLFHHPRCCTPSRRFLVLLISDTWIPLYCFCRPSCHVHPSWPDSRWPHSCTKVTFYFKPLTRSYFSLTCWDSLARPNSLHTQVYGWFFEDIFLCFLPDSGDVGRFGEYNLSTHGVLGVLDVNIVVTRCTRGFGRGSSWYILAEAACVQVEQITHLNPPFTTSISYKKSIFLRCALGLDLLEFLVSTTCIIRSPCQGTGWHPCGIFLL